MTRPNPDELRAYAEVMRDTGLTRVSLGEGIELLREVGAARDEQAAIDAQVKAFAESLKLGEEPADPRDNPLAYPDGQVPSFPSFDTTDTEEQA